MRRRAARLSMPGPEAIETFGEPCNNCALWAGGYTCEKGHRQKEVMIETGHIPELTFRKYGGCDDHVLMAGDWWHEDPIKPHQSGYGGSSTNILI